MKNNILTLVGIVLLTSACSLEPYGKNARLRIELPQQESVNLQDRLSTPNQYISFPASLSQFDCFGVNVMGPGLENFSGTYGPTNASYSDPLQCPYKGVTSNVAGISQSGVDLNVPAGPKRAIQVIGVVTGSGCPVGANFGDFVDSLRGNNTSGQNSVSTALFHEIGTAVVDLFSTQTVTIQGAYSSATPVDPFDKACRQGPRQNSLPMIAGWKGDSLDGSTYSTAPTANLPMSSTMLSYTALTPSEIASLADQNNTVPIVGDASVTSRFGRLDLAFDASNYNMSQFSTVLVKVNAVGGLATACTGNTPASSYGISVKLGTSALLWSNQGGGHSNSIYSIFNYSSVSDGPPSTFARSYSGVAPSNVIVVSIRSNTSSVGGNCSRVSVLSVEMTFQ